MRKYILIPLIYIIFRLFWWSWKITIYEPPEMVEYLKKKQGIILAHWHRDELALMQICRRYKLATIVSTSKDGELMNGVLRLNGVATSRGSSTRGGVGALKGLLTLMKQGFHSTFAVDGPKGPIYKVKPGVFEVSRLCQTPIFSAGIYVDRKKVFEKAWNKAILPLPFSHVHVHWTAAYGPITKDQDPRDEGLGLELENILRGAEATACKEFAEV
jgi:lysophospholipid acyltransferase (LPLAT)-like uncharacterized protein